MNDFKAGDRVTDCVDVGTVVSQMSRGKNTHHSKYRTLVVWDREHKGNKQTGYPLTADLTLVEA